MIRHRGFANPQHFLSELKSVTPKHVYHSAALYNDPANKIMTQKGWIGCDFVIDIDSDHMELPCQAHHDYYICMKCDHVSHEYITKCPECEGPIRKQLWLCDQCLEASKIEVLKLVDDFLPDFGFTRDNAILNFSGHRGYHIHLRENFIRSMSSSERRQIADYMTGTNFDPQDFFTYKSGNGYFLGSTIDDPGWKGRIAQTFQKILVNHETIDSFDKVYGHYKLDSKIKQSLFDENKRAQLINQLSNKHEKWTIRDLGQVGWEKLKNFLLNVSKCDIDVPVSIDVHRLIRVQGSIHGKTGFIVKPLNYYEMVNFDPLSDPIIFAMDKESYMKVKIITPKCPEIRIQDENYGPYEKEEKIEVPEAVGIFLACKGVARII
jgi:DNA primase small subunit